MVLPFLCTHTINISLIKWSKSNPESPISEKNLMHTIANSSTLQSSTASKRILSNPQMNVNAHLSPLLCTEAQQEGCQRLPVTTPRSHPTCAPVSGTQGPERMPMVSSVRAIRSPFNRGRLTQGSHKEWCSSVG